MKRVLNLILAASIAFYGSSAPSYAFNNLYETDALLSQQEEVENYQRNLTEFLPPFISYVQAQIKANLMTLEDAIGCFDNPHAENNADCYKVRQQAFQEIVPAFRRMRQYVALAEPPRKAAESLDTEKGLLWGQLVSKINLKPKHLFDEWTFLDFSQALPKVLELQALSWKELETAMTAYYQADTDEFKIQFNNSYKSQYGISPQEKINSQIWSKEGRYSSLPQEKKVHMHEVLTKGNKKKLISYQSLKRLDKKNYYREKYFEQIQSYPIIAFMRMPIENNQQKMEEEKNQCRQRLLRDYQQELIAREENLKKLYPQNKQRYQQVFEKYRKAPLEEKGQELLKLCSDMIEQGVYSFEDKDYEPILKEAYEKVWQIHKAFSQDLQNIDLKNYKDQQRALSLVGLEKLMETYVQNNIGGNEEIRAFAEKLVRQQENKELVEDLMYGTYVIGVVVVCSLGLKRTGANIIAKLFRWSVCTVVPGLGADFLFISIANDRYQRTFVEFFASPGSGPALQAISKLDSRDQDLLIEMILTAGLTITPDMISFIKNKNVIKIIMDLVKRNR